MCGINRVICRAYAVASFVIGTSFAVWLSGVAEPTDPMRRAIGARFRKQGLERPPLGRICGRAEKQYGAGEI